MARLHFIGCLLDLNYFQMTNFVKLYLYKNQIRSKNGALQTSGSAIFLLSKPYIFQNRLHGCVGLDLEPCQPTYILSSFRRYPFITSNNLRHLYLDTSCYFHAIDSAPFRPYSKCKERITLRKPFPNNCSFMELIHVWTFRYSSKALISSKVNPPLKFTSNNLYSSSS